MPRSFTAHMRGLAAAEAERMVRRLHVDAYAPYGYVDGASAGPMGLQTEPVPDELYPVPPAEPSDPGSQPGEPGLRAPDKVVVDGRRVLSLQASGPALRVVEVAGDTPRLGGRALLPYARRELLPLGGHRVLVVSSFERSWPGLPVPWRTSQTVLTLVDAADPTRPAVLRTQELTGHHVSIRVRAGVVRLVLDSPIRPPELPLFPRGPRELAVAQAREAAARASTRALLPMRQTFDAHGRLVGTEPLLRCTDVLAPARPGDGGILSVITVDTRTGADAFDHPHGIGVLGDGGLVHNSTDRLYVAVTDGPVGSGTADSTRIHAFDVTARDRSAYLVTARLPGRAVRDGALSVRGDLLRVATATPAGIVVRVLAERAGRLDVVGRSYGLGPVPMDTMRPVRWFGRYAVLTNGQLVDFTDPVRPVASGYLDAAPYAVIHPLDGERWLVIGRGAGPGRGGSGLRAVLLDASGTGAPRPTEELALGSGSASATVCPAALTYLPRAGLALTSAVLMERPVRGSHLRQRRVMHHVALAVSIGTDGTLRPAGRVLREPGVLRIAEVGSRLVVVTGWSHTLVDPVGMRALGMLRTAR